MANYTHEYSNFPDELITVKTYKDVDDDIAALVQQINEYREAGDFASANALVAENQAALSVYNVSSEDINRIVEEIRNTQIYAKESGNSVYYTDTEPTDAVINGDTWLDTTDAVVEGETETTDADRVYTVEKTGDDGHTLTALMTFRDGSTYTVSEPIAPVKNLYLEEMQLWDTDAPDKEGDGVAQTNTYVALEAGYYLACGWVTNSDGAYNTTDNKAITITTTGIKLSEFYTGYPSIGVGWICNAWIYAEEGDSIIITTVGSNSGVGDYDYYRADQYVLHLTEPSSEEPENEGE